LPARPKTPTSSGYKRRRRNFGIVTSFEYKLQPVGPVILGGMMLHPLSKAKEVLRFFRDYVAKVPDELSIFIAFVTAPKAPHLPEHIQGAPALAVLICYTGTVEEESVSFNLSGSSDRLL